jgi:hypothetical protein
MVRTNIAIGAMVAALLAIAGMPATAEVLDAVYRGTLVCDKLPFVQAKMREAIAVTISGGSVSFHHIVRLGESPEIEAEKGAGKLEGQNISLDGTWTEGKREYKASYTGAFVRRSARLKGTQSWTEGGKTVTRNCSGVIKRPLKAFLPRKKKSATP